MPQSFGNALSRNFLGNSPDWYKLTIVAFLLLNPVLLLVLGSFVAGWILIGEFIFTLAMALKCYPLPPGGLLAIEAVLLGMTNPESVYKEVSANFPIILLLMFMVAGIYFMKDFLRYVFTRILLKTHSKIVLSLLFCATGAVLSAFLDALTVIAVIIAVSYGFYDIFHRFASGYQGSGSHDNRMDGGIEEHRHRELEEFRGFLRNLMMHASVGTALGGVTTLVGEPQNLLIATTMKWTFAEFFVRMAPVTVPVLIVGLLTCFLLERFSLFGYGYGLPNIVRSVLEEKTRKDNQLMTKTHRCAIIMQGCAGAILVLSLAFHCAEVGIIGLMIIVLLTAANGIIEERRIGSAFEEALPFTSLLVVFFAIVAVIHDQHLFSPVTELILKLEGKKQLAAYYIANGLLSMVSDNVFVATVYMSETAGAFAKGLVSEEQFRYLAVAINVGTNIPSIATPNGQAAFLFLLTSALAPLIRLSYGQMVKLALPYTIVLSVAGLVAIYLL